jgi:hypothetical protein
VPAAGLLLIACRIPASRAAAVALVLLPLVLVVAWLGAGAAWLLHTGVVRAAAQRVVGGDVPAAHCGG